MSPPQMKPQRVSPHIVLEVGAKLLIPVILLFALYVQFHGEYSPGGGFQAGIIFAAALVLYTLIYGLEAVQRAVPPVAVHRAAAGGALLYLGVGFWALFAGGNFLEYKVLVADPQMGEVVGIILIELGVGITVASVVVTLFYSFSGRAPDARTLEAQQHEAQERATQAPSSQIAGAETAGSPSRGSTQGTQAQGSGD